MGVSIPRVRSRHRGRTRRIRQHHAEGDRVEPFSERARFGPRRISDCTDPECLFAQTAFEEFAGRRFVFDDQ
jgi:hypothetical protein